MQVIQMDLDGAFACARPPFNEEPPRAVLSPEQYARLLREVGDPAWGAGSQRPSPPLARPSTRDEAPDAAYDRFKALLRRNSF